MTTLRINAVIENDGELCLRNLPCRRGDRVEAVLIVPGPADSEERDAARQRFLTRARASRFQSNGAYPTRDELHERD